MSVVVYTFGICHCSVCAPKDMKPEDVVASANLQHPTGISSPWAISSEPFRNRETNPCECNIDPNRLHYLMVC